MKIYSNALCTALTVLLMATVCYGMEPLPSEGEVKKFPNFGIRKITEDYTEAIPAIITTEKKTPLQELNADFSSLEAQLAAFITNVTKSTNYEGHFNWVKQTTGVFGGAEQAQQHAILIEQIKQNRAKISENIGKIISFIGEHVPASSITKLKGPSYLSDIRQDVESKNVRHLNILFPEYKFTQLELLKDDILKEIKAANPPQLPAELMHEPSQQPAEPTQEPQKQRQIVLFPREESDNPHLKERADKIKAEIYNLELEIQQELAILSSTPIEEPSKIASLRNTIADMRAKMANLLGKTRFGIEATQDLLIAKALHSFHEIELNKNSDTKNFVDNFIKIAQWILLRGFTSNTSDQKFIEYILKSPLFQDDFITLKSAPEKKEEFAKAYSTIFNAIYPPIIPEMPAILEIPEEPAPNYPEPQKNENFPVKDVEDIVEEPAIDQEPATEVSLSEKIYRLEMEVVSTITSILRAILDNKETSSLIKSFQKTRASIMQSLKEQKKELENTSEPQLMINEIAKINLKINISQTLNYFYAIKIQKANSNKKRIVENASNSVNRFVNHFIEMAALIEKTAFDKDDRKLIEYIINDSFFIKYFAHEEETMTLVPEEKKEEFYKAYTKIIHNILKPSIIPEMPKESVINLLQPQEDENPPVEDVEDIVEKPAIDQEPATAEFNLNAPEKAASTIPQEEVITFPAIQPPVEIEAEIKRKNLPSIEEKPRHLEQNLEQNKELFIPIEPKEDRPKQPILLPYKKPNPLIKNELYDLEKKIQKILVALNKTIEEENPNTLLKNHLAKEQLRMTELLKKKTINSVSIHIARTLQDFHHLELDMLEDQEEASDTRRFVIDINNFVDNFIKIANLIEFPSIVAFNEYDKEFVIYILDSPLFDAYFATKKFVQKSKQKDFEAAYETIAKAIPPLPTGTRAEKSIANPSAQPEQQNIPVAPVEQKIESVTQSPAEQEQPVSTNLQLQVPPQPEEKLPVVAEQSIPKRMPSFLDSLMTSVSNAWEDIKNFFGGIKSGIYSWLFGLKVPTTKEIDKNAILESAQPKTRTLDAIADDMLQKYKESRSPQ